MASTWFLAVAGLTGDATVEGHENELEVAGWSWGLSNQRPSNNLAATGRPVLEDLTVSLTSDLGAVQLVRFCATSVLAETAVLTGVRSGASVPYLRYALQRVSVTSVTEATDDDGAVRYQVRLRFRGMTATFTPQNPDGSAGPPVSVDVGSLIGLV